jgi:hypothetical protein
MTAKAATLQRVSSLSDDPKITYKGSFVSPPEMGFRFRFCTSLSSGEFWNTARVLKVQNEGHSIRFWTRNSEYILRVWGESGPPSR